MSFRFNADVRNARQKEQELEAILQHEGWYTTNTNNAGVFSGYDVKAYWPATNHTTTLEVKHDRLASTTGNIAVEVSKEINGVEQPSGLSSTQADWYAFTVTEGQYHVIATDDLKAMVERCEYHRKLKGGDNFSSVLVLFNRDFLLNKCHKL